MGAFVAYRYPRKVVMYELNESIDAIPETQLDLKIWDSLLEDPQASEIHSIDIIYGQGQGFILLGMRNGYMISCHLERKDTSFSLDAPYPTKFGECQVDFITATHDEYESLQGEKQGGSVFVRCEYLWQISLENGSLRIDEVLFDDIRMVC
jgi:hypothetical protein